MLIASPSAYIEYDGGNKYNVGTHLLPYAKGKMTTPVKGRVRCIVTLTGCDTLILHDFIEKD